jgi:hypothetical protein
MKWTIPLEFKHFFFVRWWDLTNGMFDEFLCFIFILFFKKKEERLWVAISQTRYFFREKIQILILIHLNKWIFILIKNNKHIISSFILDAKEI